MSNVHQRPRGANAEPAPTETPLPAVDFSDATAVRAWLSFLREHVLDALAAGEDAARRPSERVFSRHEVRRRLADEERVITALLDAGARGLPPVASASP
ncbi:MAG: hypothetical protein U0359_30620 [Byssovorax sp.]